MKKMQLLVFEIIKFVFQEKSDVFGILAISVHKFFNQRTFAKIKNIGQHFAERKMFIATMTKTVKKTLLDVIETIYRDKSYKDAAIV